MLMQLRWAGPMAKGGMKSNYGSHLGFIPAATDLQAEKVDSGISLTLG